MRRISTFSALCLAAGLVSACSLPDEIITTENVPTAGVRFINAVPDTNLMDMRFIDIVESNAHFRIGFRANPITTGGVPASTQVQYKNARVTTAARRFRVFLDDTAQTVASVMLLDTTIALVAGSNYTVMAMGNARAGRHPAVANGLRFHIWEEAPTDPAAQVGLRLINATNAVINGRQYMNATGATVVQAGAATWGALAAYTRATTWTNVAVTTGTQRIRYNVRDVTDAAAATLFPDVSALIGAVATVDIEGFPGTANAGSAVTGIVYPASVAGSKAVVFPAAGISFVWDRRPPRTACSPLC